jgi:hypothetical protein
MAYPHIYPHLTTYIHFTPLFLFGQPQQIIHTLVKYKKSPELIPWGFKILDFDSSLLFLVILYGFH